MNYSHPAPQSLQVSALVTEQSRQRLINAAISFKEGMYVVAEPAQRQLLDQFVQGRLTIDEVVYYLEMHAKS